MSTHTFYRGYIAKADNPQPRLESAIDIAATIKGDSSFNPQIREYADAFLWVTPNKGFAEGVALVRYIAKMALDSEFREGALAGKYIPVIAQYDLPSLEGVFNVRFRNGVTPQNIVQRVDKKNVTVALPTSESLEKFLNYIAKEKLSPDNGLAKATGMDFGALMFDTENASDFTVIDGLRHVYGQSVGSRRISYEAGLEKLTQIFQMCSEQFLNGILKYEPAGLVAA